MMFTLCTDLNSPNHDCTATMLSITVTPVSSHICKSFSYLERTDKDKGVENFKIKTGIKLLYLQFLTFFGRFQNIGAEFPVAKSI